MTENSQHRLRLLFFAKVRERLGVDSLDYSTEQNLLTGLIAELQQKGEVWKQVLASQELQVAINQLQVLDKQVAIQDGDEIAFFPPVTGG